MQRQVISRCFTGRRESGLKFVLLGLVCISAAPCKKTDGDTRLVDAAGKVSPALGAHAAADSKTWIDGPTVLGRTVKMPKGCRFSVRQAGGDIRCGSAFVSWEEKEQSEALEAMEETQAYFRRIQAANVPSDDQPSCSILGSGGNCRRVTAARRVQIVGVASVGGTSLMVKCVGDGPVPEVCGGILTVGPAAAVADSARAEPETRAVKRTTTTTVGGNICDHVAALCCESLERCKDFAPGFGCTDWRLWARDSHAPEIHGNDETAQVIRALRLSECQEHLKALGAR
jgi:hypothetical protein